MDPGVLDPWYADDKAMRGMARCKSKLLHDVMEKFSYNGYFPGPDKSWHICVKGK